MSSDVRKGSGTISGSSGIVDAWRITSPQKASKSPGFFTLDRYSAGRALGTISPLGRPLGERRAAEHKIGRLLRDHQDARVDVAGDEVGHRRGVHDAERLLASYAERRIEHRALARAHRARRAGMMGGDRGPAHERVDVGVGPALGPRRHLAPAKRLDPLPARDIAAELHALTDRANVPL